MRLPRTALILLMIGFACVGMTRLDRDRAAAQPAWNFMGPQPLAMPAANFGGVLFGGPFSAAGRITAIAADPTTPGRLFVGSAGGGVWISTDGGANFKPIFDHEPSQAIGAIALDPINTAPPTLYVATGEGDGRDSHYGHGIFRSTDLGASWHALSPGTFDKEAFTSLAIDTSANRPRLFAGVTGAFSSTLNGAQFSESDPAKSGLWRSTDGGISWTQYRGKTFGCTLGAAATPCPAESVALDPLNPGQLYAGIEFDNVFTSSDGGESFAPACFTNDPQSCEFPSGTFQIDRESIAVGPPAADAPLACSRRTKPCGVVYAMLGAFDQGEYAGLFSSTDGGRTWTESSVPDFAVAPNITLDGTLPGNISDEDYDQTLLVSPANPAVVFFGGVGIYQSTDSGATWSFLASNGGATPYQHALAIGAHGDTLFLGNDGGTYRFTISGIANGVAAFSSLNETLGVAMIRSIAPHPTDGRPILAGLDDDGTGLYTGGSMWNEVDTSESGEVLFDRANPNFAYHSLPTTTGADSGRTAVNLGVSSDAGMTWSDLTADFAGTDFGFARYPPLASDPQVAERLLLGGHSVWIWNPGLSNISQQSTQDLTGGCIDGSCALQDIEFAQSDRDRAWALSTQTASAPFRLFNTTMADGNSGAIWKDVTGGLPFNTARVQASGVATDPNDSDVAYLSVLGFTASTAVGHIFRTSDFGASWTEDDGAGGPSPLPDVPVLHMLVDSNDSTGSTLYAGTDSGIFCSTDSGGTWSAFDFGAIPSLPVFDIEQNANGTIFAGTRGRGVYQLGSAAIATPAATPTPAPAGGEMRLSATSIHFPPTGIDTVTVTRELVIHNAGVAALAGSIDVSSLSPPFSVGWSGNFVLARERSRIVTIRFAPIAPGPFHGVIEIATDNPSSQTLSVSVDGAGLSGEVVAPSVLDFGRVGIDKVRKRTLRITNKGAGELHCQLDVSQLGPGFSVAPLSAGLTVAPGERRGIGVRFTPKYRGEFSGMLGLLCDDPDKSSTTVTLSGFAE